MDDRNVSRRRFCKGLLLCTLSLGSVGAPSLLAGCTGTTQEIPLLSALFIDSPTSIAQRLDAEGWEFARHSRIMGWTSTKALPNLGEIASGTTGLTLLGEDRGPDGRFITPEKFAQNTYVQAASLSVVTKNDGFKTVSQAATRIRTAHGIPRSALIGQLDAPGSQRAGNDAKLPWLYCEAASCTLRNKPGVWWLTAYRMDGDATVSLTFGMSFLDYYQRSRLIGGSYADVTAIGGPWDITTDKHFRSMSAAEEHGPYEKS